MKKILFSAAAVCATGLAMATSVESPNTFGVLKITSANAETVVSVPWEAVGTSGNPIKVKDFVMTTNMSAGDLLYLYDSSTETYKGWILTGAVEEEKSWAGLTTVTEMGGKTVEPGDNDTLARGQALIISRGGTPADSIYLYGQYNSNGVSSYTMTKGKSTLFAPVNTTSGSFYLNNADAPNGALCAASWTTPNASDIIRVQGSDGYGHNLKWNSDAGKWGLKYGGEWHYEHAIIQPGMGAWYVSKGASNVTLQTTTKVAE